MREAAASLRRKTPRVQKGTTPRLTDKTMTAFKAPSTRVEARNTDRPVASQP
jgi:hypothetical protein